MVHLSDVDFVSFLRKCKEVGAQDETTPWINLHLESSSEWSTRDQRKRLDEWRIKMRSLQIAKLQIFRYSGLSDIQVEQLHIFS